MRLLDCYVLRAIDALEADQAQALVQLEPKLARIFETQGSWHEILAKELDLPAELPSKIQEAWAEGVKTASALGYPIQPCEFAALFVDTNFPMPEE